MELLESRSIFSPATGFIQRGGFQWTCNPYLGCTFGCTYCYAAFLPQNRQPAEQWGRWLVAKKNAVTLAHRQAKKVAGQAVYMSSVTDPYLPAERTLMLSRGILEAMLPFQPRLVVQTRGPLVVRDIDVLQDYRHLRVNVSIPTDSEAIRRRFEPKAPPLDQRWMALGQLQAAGLAVGICVTPTLPIQNVTEFVKKLTHFAPDVLVCQNFHDAGGRFGADTGPAAWQLLSEFGWNDTHYRQFVDRLRGQTTVFEGAAGFFPPPGPTPQPTWACESRA
ncbi:MAG: radical SAM protein [Gemmataceae bacterium]|nr:radical SAM protein [Gemmata sp.]MDW8199052.1 radical SAM protein [Gemmataceae bacterium]